MEMNLNVWDIHREWHINTQRKKETICTKDLEIEKPQQLREAVKRKLTANAAKWKVPHFAGGGIIKGSHKMEKLIVWKCQNHVNENNHISVSERF